MRIELTQSAWKAEVLPLNYICNLVGIFNYTRNLGNVNHFLEKITIQKINSNDSLLLLYENNKKRCKKF